MVTGIAPVLRVRGLNDETPLLRIECRCSACGELVSRREVDVSEREVDVSEREPDLDECATWAQLDIDRWDEHVRGHLAAARS